MRSAGVVMARSSDFRPLRHSEPTRPPRPTIWSRPYLTLKETIQNLVEFLVNGGGSGFGGFGPNFGCIDALHEN